MIKFESPPSDFDESDGSRELNFDSSNSENGSPQHSQLVPGALKRRAKQRWQRRDHEMQLVQSTQPGIADTIVVDNKASRSSPVAAHHHAFHPREEEEPLAQERSPMLPSSPVHADDNGTFVLGVAGNSHLTSEQPRGDIIEQPQAGQIDSKVLEDDVNGAARSGIPANSVRQDVDGLGVQVIQRSVSSQSSATSSPSHLSSPNVNIANHEPSTDKPQTAMLDDNDILSALQGAPSSGSSTSDSDSDKSDESL
jgi:hypothetical protein